LRWRWGFTGFEGLRDNIDEESLAMFENFLPRALRKLPNYWSDIAIFQYFVPAYKILVWSCFMKKIKDLKGFLR